METDNFKNFMDDLSDEEKKVLEKIEARIAETLKEVSNKKYDHLENDNPIDFSDKHPDIIPPTHITAYPHEIRVSMVIEISSVNGKGYLEELKELVKKNYHIPVPPDKDYMEYAEKFIKNFESKLTKSCREEISPDILKNE